MTRTGVLVDKDGIEQFGVRSCALSWSRCSPASTWKPAAPASTPTAPSSWAKCCLTPWACPTAKDPARLVHGCRNIGKPAGLPAGGGHSAVPRLPEAELHLRGGPAQGDWRRMGRIHSTFNQTEARTGRLSSDNPNLQNIPIRTELGSQLRAYFIAKPGCVLVDADYSQIELRILAHITGDEHMQQAFLERRRTSTAAPPPKFTASRRAEVTPVCALLPRPSTLASCTARVPTALPRTSA